ncbi:hypothetical protein [Rhizobium laguerreae]|uniref:hypothetical protein n=1 Tax=Rhizobium laguerreae TaxID=1076926 RepID=UPI001C909D08|nr:hypothetical protein [Rhizobium laguerreae]MBY3568956.1 hypothetical protein [Rhizobium laguerreae]
MNTILNSNEPDKKHGPGIQEAYRLVSGEITQLRQARIAIDAKLQKAEAAQDLLRQLLKDSDSSNAPASDRGPGRKRFHKGSLTQEVVTRCLKLLKDAGRPLDRSELLRGLEQSGFKVEASNPPRFVGRALWESSEFTHVPRAGYWLANEPLPAS